MCQPRLLCSYIFGYFFAVLSHLTSQFYNNIDITWTLFYIAMAKSL